MDVWVVEGDVEEVDAVVDGEEGVQEPRESGTVEAAGEEERDTWLLWLCCVGRWSKRLLQAGNGAHADVERGEEERFELGDGGGMDGQASLRGGWWYVVVGTVFIEECIGVASDVDARKMEQSFLVICLICVGLNLARLIFRGIQAGNLAKVNDVNTISRHLIPARQSISYARKHQTSTVCRVALIQ